MTRAPGPRPPAPLRGKVVGFIGAGTMGQALMCGLLAMGVRPRSIWAADPSTVIRRRVARLGVQVVASNDTVAQRAHVLIIAVKPQEMPAVLAGLAVHVNRRQLVISIAAGITIRTLRWWLPGVPLVRVMPNLPATVGLGFSAYTMGPKTSVRHRAMARTILEAVGVAVELPERLLNAITAVSGSGPAYVFFLAQAWEDAACALGLPRGVARQAVCHTLAGSVRLLAQGELSPQEWIQRVASKRGTTEAALRVLVRGQVRQHVTAAVRAAARRSKELSCSLRTN